MQALKARLYFRSVPMDYLTADGKLEVMRETKAWAGQMGDNYDKRVYYVDVNHAGGYSYYMGAPAANAHEHEWLKYVSKYVNTPLCVRVCRDMFTEEGWGHRASGKYEAVDSKVQRAREGGISAQALGEF